MIGVSQTWHAVYGETQSVTGGAGVFGEHKGSGTGVGGHSQAGIGVAARSETGTGVHAHSETYEAVHAETNSATTAAIAAYAVNPQGTGAALYAESRSRGPAGLFKGDVIVTGDISLANADCAEDFDIVAADTVAPGTVMVLGNAGGLCPCRHAYDKRVAGVISGAGDYKPGIVLDRQPSTGNRQPVALLGKVYCKVDAAYAPVEVGDMLTTSDTPGYAMKAGDPSRAFGTVIGKALGALEAGQAMIPILVALQ